MDTAKFASDLGRQAAKAMSVASTTPVKTARSYTLSGKPGRLMPQPHVRHTPQTKQAVLGHLLGGNSGHKAVKSMLPKKEEEQEA